VKSIVYVPAGFSATLVVVTSMPSSITVSLVFNKPVLVCVPTNCDVVLDALVSSMPPGR